MIKLAVRNGLIIGLISFTWLLFSYFTNLHTPNSSGAVKGLLNIVILAFGIFLGIKEASKAQTNGHNRFWHLFRLGFLISIIVALLTFIGRYLYFAFINRDFGQALAGNSSLEYSPFWLAMVSLLVMLGAGIVISFFSSLIIVKRK
jgi:hypothetical protein